MIDWLTYFAPAQYWVYLLCSIAVASCVIGWIRYKNLMNPLSWFAAFDLGLLLAVSSITCLMELNISGYAESALSMAVIMSCLFGFSVLFSHVFTLRFLEKPLSVFFEKICSERTAELSAKFSRRLALLLMAIGVSLYVAMASFGGGDGLWITAPREAYISYRSGVGFLWAASNWCVVLSMITFLWRDRLSSRRTFWTCILYSCVLYFWGSKAAVVTIWFAAFTLYHFKGKPISVYWALIGLPFAVIVFFGLMMAHGSTESFESPVMYFKDYINTAALAFDTPGLFAGDGMGYGHLTEMWRYVPRLLVPEKPFEYGVLLLHKELFPGAAITGNTPGIASWALSYYDFGAIGVLIYGVLLGKVQRCSYLNFRKNPNIGSFVAYMQFGFCNVFLYAFPIISLSICFVGGLIAGRGKKYGQFDHKPSAGTPLAVPMSDK